VAILTYREAIGAAIRQEMERDGSVVLLGEDIALNGGVFKTTAGMFDAFGPVRVRDTPISEVAIASMAMGAAMNGLKPIVEIMFGDFIATCWDVISTEIARTPYMSGGQVALPLVIKTASGGTLGFGGQHSSSLENWAMAVPGLKVVSPSTPADMKGLLAAAIRDPDPVVVFEQKALYATKGEVPDGEHVVPLGQAATLATGGAATLVSVGHMAQRSLEVAERLRADGIEVTVLDLRTLVPLDVEAILGSVRATGRLFTVEENPRLCGWGAEVASIVAEEAIYDLDGPIVRITAPHVPVPAARVLENAVIPSVERIEASIRAALA
jgi:pyruvate/2-oxoglutarate/acetoin dehydrogenase E1 component